MRRVLRQLAIALVALILVATPVASLAAEQGLNYYNTAAAGTPPMFDALVLRPLGLMALVAGAILWVPAEGITLITRPTDGLVPAKALIWGPMKYVFVDPLGSH